MAIVSLICSITMLVMVLCGIVSPQLVYGLPADEIFKRIDSSMLRTTVGSSPPQQQAIVPVTGATSTVAPPPPADGFVVSQRNAAPLTRDEQLKINQEKLKLLEEVRQWDAHKEAVAKRPRRTKSKRRPAPPIPTANLDPKKTWEAFLRHTATQNARDKKKSTKKVPLSVLRTPFRRDPDEIRLARVIDVRSGSNDGMSRQDMIEHMRELIRDATERGISHVDKKCTANSTNPDCVEKRNPAGHPLLEIGRAALIPETYSAFTWRLSQKVKVRKQREVELKPYYRPRLTGSIERGDGLHEDVGKFVAPVNGLYIFNANVFFNVSLAVQKQQPQQEQQQQQQPSKNALDGVVILKLCIEENCASNLSLQAMQSVTPNGGIFTLNLSGPLQLTTGQSVSLYVTNKGKMSLVRVLEDSTFSGYLQSYL